MKYNPKYDKLTITLNARTASISLSENGHIGSENVANVVFDRSKQSGLSVETDAVYYPGGNRETGKEQTARGTTLRAGIPNFGNFLGPLFGVGGRGTYTDTRGNGFGATYYQPYLNQWVVIVEWPSDCTITEDVN